ncbi:MAG: hypothetical protein J6Q40_04785 [Tidjanibacter sp.]|nr:hypothetical protein [Tidjanibacter sp.]
MRTLFIIMAALLFAGTVRAQVGIVVRSSFEIQEEIKKSIDSLTIELGLDKKQAKKMKKAMEYDYSNDVMSQASVLITELNLNFPNFDHESVEKENRKRDERYAKFLTPEQFEKWKANEEEAARRKAEENQRAMEEFQKMLDSGAISLGSPN